METQTNLVHNEEAETQTILSSKDIGIQTEEVIDLRNADTGPYNDDIVNSKCQKNQEVCCLNPTSKHRFK